MLPGFDDNQPLCLRLDVLSYHDRPPKEKSACIFAQRGGNLGRATENDFVLPDSEGVVSRVHAEIEYRDGDYFLIDKSTNGTFVNDAPDALETGHEYLIHDGDRILIGDFLIGASLVLLDERSDRNGPPGAAERLIDMGATEPATDAFGEDEAALGEFSGKNGWSSDARRPDWFPKGEDDVSRVKTSPTGIESVREQAPVPVLQHHMAQSASPATEASADRSRDVAPAEDEKQSTGTRVPTGYVPFADQFEGFAEGELLPEAVPAEMPLPPVESERLDQTSDGRNGSATELAQSDQTQPATEANVEPGDLQPPTAKPLPAAKPSGVVSGHGGTGAVGPAAPLDAQLLAAFLRGLDLSSLQVAPEKAPVFMEQMGRVVHEAVQGLIDTLRLRAEFKREFYVPVTSIAPIDNNLFKYSVNVEDAMSRLMSESRSAYMGPAESTRQAFQDVAAHHLALVAGMEAAMTTLLERFSPVALQERIGKASVLEGVVPQVRKARMWEEFEKEYQQIADQAAEDFQEVFGQNFARAYTEQIRRLESAGFGDNKQS